ncbi:MAG TPA: hypothetical protein VMF61_00920 [Candidatus Acidoferrales bacterium]|nr:hypothetical protein [Candidatus Acidoferrales bacterium]
MTDDQFTAVNAAALDPRRVLACVIPGVALAVCLSIWPKTSASLALDLGIFFLVTLALGFSWWSAPRQIRKAYLVAEQRWSYILKRSDPQAILATSLQLHPGEFVYYSEPGSRIEERQTGQVIQTQSRTKNAISSAIIGSIVAQPIGAVLGVRGGIAGPVGAIVGGNMARRETTGTATTVYENVVVDNGEVVVTSRRFVFLGARNTVEVPTEEQLRALWPDENGRLEVQYPHRQPGEAYTVDGLLFRACLARRAPNGSYPMPEAPEPLAPSHGLVYTTVRALPPQSK